MSAFPETRESAVTLLIQGGDDSGLMQVVKKLVPVLLVAALDARFPPSLFDLFYSLRL